MNILPDSPAATPSDALIARVRTAAQAFWSFAVTALAVFLAAKLGLDLTEQSMEVVTAVVAFSTPVVAAVLLLAVDLVGRRFPVVKRLWVFVDSPTYSPTAPVAEQ